MNLSTVLNNAMLEKPKVLVWLGRRNRISERNVGKWEGVVIK